MGSFTVNRSSAVLQNVREKGTVVRSALRGHCDNMGCCLRDTWETTGGNTPGGMPGADKSRLVLRGSALSCGLKVMWESASVSSTELRNVETQSMDCMDWATCFSSPASLHDGTTEHERMQQYWSWREVFGLSVEIIHDGIRRRVTHLCPLILLFYQGFQLSEMKNSKINSYCKWKTERFFSSWFLGKTKNQDVT